MIENDDREWYNSLKKPSFQPPANIFAPTWTVLYFMMFDALALVATLPFTGLHVLAYLLFVLQLVVNLSWAPVFFETHALRKAFWLSMLLALLVFLTMCVFFFISRLAALLFLPYFLWCCFATILSFEIWELNSD